jgi:fermentation-respiration switch protein FrsA (DUF1100 family)
MSFLGADYGAHPEVWRDASPIFHVAKSNVPILIIHGTHDETVSISQAEELNDALTKAGATVKFLQLDSSASPPLTGGLLWKRRLSSTAASYPPRNNRGTLFS